ncbi:twin-arginine translocase TatA/TatE family subunit [Leifsonia shinshuensis]|uniref:twin-arginine translocase TatA/TatE family subunit n=1 Tax=Leifsonia shinshuensis TaxID=150026 RepID=UPI001F50D4E2|nr:twin-arginine translocase TatA/TatE family subunit [Leifsonia shinshuensis]MCI0158805.1 twin-arginine translocase TatA/TatE family subunit [Leifsonia shinshuensis]
MLGLTMDKLVIIAVIAVFLLGPKRLPVAAHWLGQAVRSMRRFADTAKERAREELGDSVDEIEWTKLDPRQYDPRRIIREALSDPPAGSDPRRELEN